MEKPHKRLIVWQRTRELVKEIYRATQDFPGTEKYGLTSQIRRAAVSILANLSEGAARQGTAEFIQFVHTAMGSCSEVDALLEISCELGFLDEKVWHELDQRIAEIDRMLVGLRNYLRRKQASRAGRSS